ncbi:sensor histidine kinase [Lysobacter sp. A3-1-A15]|uniref:sensor histidine kinase n=1 Tax=Novilysobacter viscosus TaxID=3098602 RepID=UPI002EDABC64
MSRRPPTPSDLPLEALRDQYQRLLQRLEANEREFRRLGRSVLRVQEDERRRLARELHDGLGQNLTALKHRLARIGDGLTPAQAALRDQLDAAIALCGDTLEDTRELSRLLRPPILDDLGLDPALHWLARTVGESSGLAIAVEVEALPVLEGDVETLMFRIAQEALHNIVRHADARNVLVRVVARGGLLQLQVVDDGRGCDPEIAQASGGSGLGGMRERLRLHEGHLQLHASPGNGTRLRAVVPLENPPGTASSAAPA